MSHNHYAAASALVAGLIAFAASPARAQSPITLTVPQPYQVIQRVGYDPSAESPTGRGSAEVVVAGTLPEVITARTSLEYRLLPLEGEPHEKSSSAQSNWKHATLGLSKPDDRNFHVSIVVPAGWHRLEVRATERDGKRFEGAVEPIGVGEVFLVAGQSYASNSNDERLSVQDPQRRVVAFDWEKNSWGVANDPQPTADESDAGSIWPAVGDLLLKELKVPIAFGNVAYGGTSSTQWLPDAQPVGKRKVSLHLGLIECGKQLGRFRAVLWQQGESDVIEKTSGEQYIANLKRIRKTAVRAWGFEPVWLAAKSTHHPTVYNQPETEETIRKAIEQLSELPGFGAGPDTDTLQGDNRGDAKSKRHFTAVGQRRAAELWHKTLMEHLAQVPSGIEAASFLLNDLHLLEPAWRSEIVYGESCVLRTGADGGLPKATLAFEPAEIIDVVTADQQHQFDLVQDCSCADARERTLTFQSPGPVQPIADAELYLPPDSPNSYKHRVGHPEQNLLFRPGRWFHDRDIEVTYRRDLARESLTDVPVTFGSLPKTLDRLSKGDPITLGISGDSISTGLDASVKTGTPPFQPGYPDLVVAQLQVLSDSEISLKNRAVGGWSVANGVKDLDAMLAEKPHLIIVAYGMNDVGRKDPKWFYEQTKTIIDRARAADPNIEILLVSPMLGNSEWVHTPREMFTLYRDQLKALVTPGIALADVTAVWQMMLEHKGFLDLTGNGLNHPNDFGHRLYAQAVLQLLKEF
ncbi:MAG: GDSL-type esterase/lipase family protein [Aureliella sp.]